MMTSEKRALILQATLDLISEQGFHGTAMSMIVRRAGVGVGTIYRYFEDKEGLIGQLYLKLKLELSEAVFDGYSEQMPLRERFRTMWINALKYYMLHPKETAFIEQYVNSPFLEPEAEAALMEYFGPMFAFFEHARREGIIKEMSVKMIEAFTLGVAISLAKQYTAGDIVLDDAEIEMAVDACWDAISR